MDLDIRFGYFYHNNILMLYTVSLHMMQSNCYLFNKSKIHLINRNENLIEMDFHFIWIDVLNNSSKGKSSMSSINVCIIIINGYMIYNMELETLHIEYNIKTNVRRNILPFSSVLFYRPFVISYCDTLNPKPFSLFL